MNSAWLLKPWKYTILPPNFAFSISYTSPITMTVSWECRPWKHLSGAHFGLSVAQELVPLFTKQSSGYPVSLFHPPVLHFHTSCWSKCIKGGIVLWPPVKAFQDMLPVMCIWSICLGITGLVGYTSHADEYSCIYISMMVIHGYLRTVWWIARPILELQLYQNMLQKGVSKGYTPMKLS